MNDNSMLDEVVGLYETLLSGWNSANAERFASVFADDGQVIGFDGSEVEGRAAIARQMASIFEDHATGKYVGVVRNVRGLGTDAALLRAVSGVVPGGSNDINPDLNATQTLVARREEGKWSVVIYHNTPAQYHGRPDAVADLSAELREQLKNHPAGGPPPIR